MHRKQQQPVPVPTPTPTPAPARRKGAAASREWLVVTAAGEAGAEEFGKHRIMEMTGLPARDLRALDPLLLYPSTILGREKAIVINLEHIKAIVTAGEALIPKPGNPQVRPFLLDLQSRLAAAASSHGVPLLAAPDANTVTDHAKVLPFEFKVLEVCLESACKCLESETSALEKEAYPALDELTSKISTLNLEHVRQIKSRLVELSGRVQKVRDELEHLLDDDMDMAEMYLTRKLSFQGVGELSGRVDSNKYTTTERDHEGEEEACEDETESGRESFAYIKPSIEELEMLLEAYFVQVDGTLNKLYHPSIEELEMLLEAYFVQVDGTLNKLYHLREYVDDTEDYINIMLDEKQNQLLQIGVMLTTATVVATAGVVVVSLFGMNIHIDLMKDPKTPEQAKIKNLKFWETTWGTVVGCVIIYLLAIYWGKKSKILQ